MIGARSGWVRLGDVWFGVAGQCKDDWRRVWPPVYLPKTEMDLLPHQSHKVRHVEARNGEVLYGNARHGRREGSDSRLFIRNQRFARLKRLCEARYAKARRGMVWQTEATQGGRAAPNARPF